MEIDKREYIIKYMYFMSFDDKCYGKELRLKKGIESIRDWRRGLLFYVTWSENPKKRS